MHIKAHVTIKDTKYKSYCVWYQHNNNILHRDRCHNKTILNTKISICAHNITTKKEQIVIFHFE